MDEPFAAVDASDALSSGGASAGPGTTHPSPSSSSRIQSRRPWFLSVAAGLTPGPGAFAGGRNRLPRQGRPWEQNNRRCAITEFARPRLKLVRDSETDDPGSCRGNGPSPALSAGDIGALMLPAAVLGRIGAACPPATGLTQRGPTWRYADLTKPNDSTSRLAGSGRYQGLVDGDVHESFADTDARRRLAGITWVCDSSRSRGAQNDVSARPGLRPLPSAQQEGQHLSMARESGIGGACAPGTVVRCGSSPCAYFYPAPGRCSGGLVEH